ncbi:DUF6507 family protein [Curtobacterium sp. Leaf261]|uniref:DUF6507 family protein n=1 Tax=Curtobacterium sp. Leaf261 TaxID=1736311 RepID=UPI000B15B8FC
MTSTCLRAVRPLQCRPGTRGGVTRHDASTGRIEAHIGAVLQAAASATAAFVVGDEEMAENAARAAADPVPPSVRGDRG